MGSRAGAATRAKKTRSGRAELRSPQIRGVAKQQHHLSAHALSLWKANPQSDGAGLGDFATAVPEDARNRANCRGRSESRAFVRVRYTCGSLRESAGL